MSVNTKVNGQLVKSAGLYSVTAPIGMADIYSTEEKEVGLWKNNKPLYQKTIVVGNGDVNVNTDSGNGTYRAVVDSGVSNIDEGFAVVDKSFMILSSDSSPRYFTWVDYQGKGSSQFVVYTNASRTNVTVVLTIQYTKTTDTPWSGKFVPQGYGYVSSGDIYSFEERQVGVFADGKPLYQKTVDCGALPANTTKTVAHNVSNVDNIVELKGVTYSTTNGYTLPLEDLDADVGVSSTIRLYANATNIYIKTKTDQSVYDETYVTIKYTKTTDVAGSGEYVPSGDKAVHYSENEEVIGTWIDGKTLYRRTITGLSIQLNGTTWVNYNPSISIDKLINVHAYYEPTNGLMTCAIAEYQYNNTVGIQLTAVQGYNRTVNTLTIEYTKTS